MWIYYRIWLDSITRLRSSELTKTNWQFKSMISMSIAMTSNFVLLMVTIQREIFGYYFYELNISLFSDFENYIFTMLILYASPCIIINYLLIFHGKRYEKLLEKYPHHYNGKLFLIYFLASLFLPVILIWIGIFVYQ
jgi:hypothetical protein